MPAGKGETFRAETSTRCLIIRSGCSWEHDALQSSPIMPCMEVWGTRLWERMWKVGKKWLFFLHGGGRNPLPSKKEKEERNFTSEILHFVNTRCTRLWKLKEGSEKPFAFGNIRTYVCSLSLFSLHMFSSLFSTMFSTLDYSRGGTENKTICENLKLWASRKSQYEVI